MTNKELSNSEGSGLVQRSLPTGTATLPQYVDDPTPRLLNEPESTTAENFLKDYTAPISLPRREDITVKLGPVNLVDRLDEYQSDENLLTFFLGIFIGAIVGIVSNWATEREFVVTPFSLILLAIFAALAIGSGVWLKRIRERRKKVKNEIDGLH